MLFISNAEGVFTVWIKNNNQPALRLLILVLAILLVTWPVAASLPLPIGTLLISVLVIWFFLIVLLRFLAE